jgi:phosphomannomutase
MVRTGKKPSELLKYLYSKVGEHRFKRLDVEFPEDERQAITERIRKSAPQTIEGVKVAKVDTFDGFRFTLVDGSWLLIRFSGTEPILRIYAESDSTMRVEKLIDFARKLAGV